MPVITRALVDAILAQFRLPLHGIHGPSHWARVLENGRRLAPLTGADCEVVELFALFHDACRHNESLDPGHGARGASLAASLAGSVLSLEPRCLALLATACRLHTRGRTDGDVTVRTCWDADRLDLGRVGITPRPARLCTEAARDRELLRWADRRAWHGELPVVLKEEWGLDLA